MEEKLAVIISVIPAVIMETAAMEVPYRHANRNVLRTEEMVGALTKTKTARAATVVMAAVAGLLRVGLVPLTEEVAAVAMQETNFAALMAAREA
jgi:hypothetical protein